MRHERLNHLHPVCIKLASVTSAHQPQDLVVTALQGHMKMRHELSALSNKANDFFGKQIRLDRRDPVSLNAGHIIQRLYELIKVLFMSFRTIRALSEIAQVHSGQNDLLYTLLCQLLCMMDDVANAIAPALAPGHWDSTKGTGVITSILDR